MKITAVVSEFNPFHKGHEYILKKARDMTGADFVIALMSGNFVQRGEPALFDMGIRTRAALLNGADAVFELPPQFSLSSAEGFAEGAVGILNKLGVDHMAFGSECGDIESLKKAAAVLSEEDDGYRTVLKEKLKEGAAFPAAREAAFFSCIKGSNDKNKEELTQILREPNNILAIEYLKALNKTGSSINPVTAVRVGSAYHDVSSSGSAYSAESIRKMIFCPDPSFNELPSIFPELEYISFALRDTGAVHRDSLTPLLLYKLLSPGLKAALRKAAVSGDLSSRIIKNRDFSGTFTEFTELIKTKNITYTAVSRHLLHLILNMDYESLPPSDICRNIDYVRLLGFRQDAGELFSGLKKHSMDMTILGNSSDIRNYLSVSGEKKCACSPHRTFLEENLRIDRIYNILRNDKKRREHPLPPEISRRIITL